jgi:uncharacterized circularly permuted ATP-grasp superfamily protein
MTLSAIPYRPERGVHDEALLPDGRPRAASAPVLERLADADLDALAVAVAGRLREDGVVFHNAVGDDSAFVVDPIPRIIPAQEWARIEAGVAQRALALNAFVADVYGARRAVAEGVVPARVVDGAQNLEPGMQGAEVPAGQWNGVAGLDLVRAPDGEVLVLEDNCMTPSGFAYAEAARAAVLAELPGVEAEPQPLDELAGLLAGTLRAAAPAVADPRAIVLTDGVANSAYWEHERAAALLGVPLVEPGELTVRGEALEHDGRPVDVIYRRTDADRLDTPVGALLAPPMRAGRVAVVNQFGTGVADDKLVHAYVEDLVRFYLGEPPILRSVPTLDLLAPGELERALDTVEELVVKPRAGHGGIGVVIGPLAEPAELEALRGALRERPEAYVAQPCIQLSQHPTVIDGRLAPRHVDLRPFAFLRGTDEARVLPGGLTRVAFGEGALVVNSTQNGGAKDTWVT